MSKEVLFKQGVFSKLTITLNDDVVQNLALTEKDKNPLASVEVDLDKVLKKFEKAYFKAYQATNPHN